VSEGYWSIFTQSPLYYTLWIVRSTSHCTESHSTPHTVSRSDVSFENRKDILLSHSMLWLWWSLVRAVEELLHHSQHINITSVSFKYLNTQFHSEFPSLISCQRATEKYSSTLWDYPTISEWSFSIFTQSTLLFHILLIVRSIVPETMTETVIHTSHRSRIRVSFENSLQSEFCSELLQLVFSPFKHRN